MMKTLSGCMALILLCFVVGGMTGCSWWNKDGPPAFQSRGFEKMLDLQKQKSAVLNADAPTTGLIPEPDAADMERLGDQYVRQGDLSMAFVYYDKSVRMDPRRNAARYKKGSLFLTRNMLDEAAEEFNAIL